MTYLHLSFNSYLSVTQFSVHLKQPTVIRLADIHHFVALGSADLVDLLAIGRSTLKIVQRCQLLFVQLNRVLRQQQLCCLLRSNDFQPRSVKCAAIHAVFFYPNICCCLFVFHIFI